MPDAPSPAAVIACELGPNCAPITELMWALHTQRGLHVAHLELLTNREGERFVHELHHALGQWAQVMGPPPTLALGWVVDAAGARVDDDVTPAQVQAWMQARWRTYRVAIERAGDGPVVFAIASNRPRTVLTTAMFTLLARPQDLCVDVRVSEPRVEGGRAGFFFPDQRTPCADEQGPIDPLQVQVHVVDLQLPRLRPLLRPGDLSTYAAALAATQTRVHQAEQPVLAVRWATPPVVEINGAPLPLSDAQALWISALALARSQGEGWVAGSDRSWLHRALDRCRVAAGTPHWQPYTRAFTPGAGDAALRRLRSVSSAAVAAYCRAHAVPGQHLVVPAKERVGRSSRQRLALSRDRIDVADGNVP